ncbi:hypothetical protein ACU4GI_26470 [Cupriavidus basilensis]
MKEETRYVVVEDFEQDSDVYQGGAKIRVTVRRDIDYQPSRFMADPYCLDLRVGNQLISHYGLSEIGAREAACRFLLQHVKGIAPVLH